MAKRGAGDEGLSILTEGLAAYRATGAELFRSYGLTLLAELHGEAKRPEEGLACIREAIEHGAAHDVHFFDAETFRIQSRLLLQDGRPARAAAEALGRAIDIAASQGASMLEARARYDLAALQL
jgi:predicted ATPase